MPAMRDTPFGHVLVVDDDVDMGKFMLEGLRAHGFEPEAVTAGAEALARVASGSFDAVITDLRMKGMNGLELCRALQQHTTPLPVIVLTAFGDYTAAVEAVRAGAYDFLAKPVKLDVLAFAVSRAVERHRLQQEVKRLSSSLAVSHGGRRGRA